MDLSSKMIDRGACAARPGSGCRFRSIGDFADKSGKVGPQQVWQCVDCGLGVTMPPLRDVAFLYEGRASQDFQQGGGSLTHWIKRLAFRGQARTLLRHAACEPRRVLDFACGSGLFTRCLGDALPGAEVVGSDFHDDPPSDLADRPYLPLAALEARDEAFDLVLAMHVLEHDDDALGLLRRIAAKAASGATIVIEVPNIDCVWAQIFRQAWDAWYLPFHRSHFSHRSLGGLVASAGLEIVGDHAICLPSMGRSLANLFGARNGLPFLLIGIALHPLQWLGEKLTRRPSALHFVLRKP